MAQRKVADPGRRDGGDPPATRAARAPWWIWAGAGVVVALVVAAVGWAGWYRSSFHLWPWQDIPPRIHWCGRDYDRGPGPAVSERDVRETFGTAPRTVAEVPPLRGHDLVAASTQEEVRRRDPAAAGCATLVYLRVGPSRYLVYELQGSL
jgi:hypothetical protein